MYERLPGRHEPSPEPLRAAALSGGRWSALSSLGRQLASTGATVVLARILSPADYGIVTAVAVVLGVFELLSQFGIGQSLVRVPVLDEETKSTTFWAAVFLAVLVASAVVLFAGPLGSVIGQVGISPYLRVASIGLAASMVASVPAGLLSRSMRWRSLATTQLAGSAVQLVVSVGLALTTALGAWVIIIGRLAGSMVAAAGLFRAERWSPRMMFSGQILRRDLSFNLGYWGTYATSYLAKNLDYWVVGRWLGAAALGAYYIAFVLPALVRQRITRVVESVMFPVLANVSDDRGRLQGVYLDALGFTSFVTLPSVLGVAAVAELAIPVLFGSQWMNAIRPMELLAISAAFDSLIPVGTALFLALGVPSRNALVTSVRVVVLGAGLALVARNPSLEAVSGAVVLASIAAATTAIVLVVRRLRLPPLALVTVAARPALAATAMAAVVVVFVTEISRAGLPPIVALAASVVVGAAVYVVLARVLLGRRFFRYVRDLGRLLGRRA